MNCQEVKNLTSGEVLYRQCVMETPFSTKDDCNSNNYLVFTMIFILVVGLIALLEELIIYVPKNHIVVVSNKSKKDQKKRILTHGFHLFNFLFEKKGYHDWSYQISKYNDSKIYDKGFNLRIKNWEMNLSQITCKTYDLQSCDVKISIQFNIKDPFLVLIHDKFNLLQLLQYEVEKITQDTIAHFSYDELFDKNDRVEHYFVCLFNTTKFSMKYGVEMTDFKIEDFIENQEYESCSTSQSKQMESKNVECESSDELAQKMKWFDYLKQAGFTTDQIKTIYLNELILKEKLNKID